MIGIVDYGMGNLRSVSKALEHLGAAVKVSGKAADIKKADKVVLPGVGAFGDAMREIRFSRLEDPLKEAVRQGKPFLGICLGLQLLFEGSDESPEAEGLGVFSGRVRQFDDPEVKVPHMGWNQLTVEGSPRILRGLESGAYFYFVHSFYAASGAGVPSAGLCEYGKTRFAAVLEQNNVFATQFHPEKSQSAGLKILENFIAL